MSNCCNPFPSLHAIWLVPFIFFKNQLPQQTSINSYTVLPLDALKLNCHVSRRCETRVALFMTVFTVYLLLDLSFLFKLWFALWIFVTGHLMSQGWVNIHNLCSSSILRKQTWLFTLLFHRTPLMHVSWGNRSDSQSFNSPLSDLSGPIFCTWRPRHSCILRFLLRDFSSQDLKPQHCASQRVRCRH